jgi:glyoxylase-like metal-dependent hydrolase (beta-lactamase superfamily II)
MSLAPPLPAAATALDRLTVRVTAANPSPMTLEGTNTYVLGAAGEALVVDPGPALPGHRSAVEGVLRSRALRPAAVLLTHHHADHSEAAWWARAWGAALRAPDPARVPRGAVRIRDGDRVAAHGVHLEAVATPGHTDDHICLRVLETGVVLSGDHVLGRGTTVVAHPEGDLPAYLASLDRLDRCAATRLYPAHGPVVEDAAGRVAGYRAHRLEREEQVLAALGAGDATPAQIVARVYAEVPTVLHPAAEHSVRAHLAALVGAGRVRAGDGDRHRLA